MIWVIIHSCMIERPKASHRIEGAHYVIFDLYIAYAMYYLNYLYFDW